MLFFDGVKYMRAVVQRVKEASLRVDGKLISEIKNGMVVFLGVGKEDNEEDLTKLSKKISNLRIFEDVHGKINLSIKDVGGQILLVSQFTLYADYKHGNRPSFFDAQEPIIAEKMYKNMQKSLQNEGISVKMGVFGADMKISQLNDGPFTIVLDSKNL